MLKPFLANKLNTSVAKRILQTVILPKATYLSRIWDQDAQFTIYQQLKELLRAPFHLPMEALHALAHITPQKANNMKGRLQLVKQLLLTKGNLSDYPKDPLTQLMASEAA